MRRKIERWDKTVHWFSGGVSSFIAAYLARDQIDDIIYIHIDDHHPDTLRFLSDCEQALDREIVKIRSSKYNSVDDVIRKEKFISSPGGSPCTEMLKRKVREKWERENDPYLRYVWGYDCNEQHRADWVMGTMPQYSHIFPLIEANFTKEDAHGLLARLGIARPAMYDLGYSNNNCIGCVKGGMGYWNKIRIDFPEVFTARAALEREVGGSCVNGVYLDELEPQRGRMSDEIMQECGLLCHIAYETINCGSD